MGAFLQAPPRVDVPLSLFGGTDSELSPSDCPEGVSPDNQDVIFTPGSFESRPGLGRIFASPTGAPFLYEKTYVQPNGVPLNLYLDANGALWVENVSVAPNVLTQIGSVAPGLYAQSVSAFGREYIAFSDLIHGQGIPLQFDGTNLDRVSQDGPGANASIGDENVSVAITASPNGLSPVTSNIASISEAGNIVTATVNAFPLSLVNGAIQAGDTIKISGVTPTGYNATVQISAFSVAGGVATFQWISGAAGLAAGAGGTIGYSLALVTPSTVDASIVTANPSLVTIVSAGVAGYNGTWAYRGNVIRIPPPSYQFYVYIPNAFLLANSGNGTAFVAGSASVGLHKFVVMFLTRQGYLTKPSPVGFWNTGGGKRAVVTNVPIGPANVVARVFGFTGAGGGFFFIIPTTTTLPQASGPAIVTTALAIFDNTSTSAIFDFSDNALFAAIPIDQIGNNLFDQAVLGPVAGFFSYDSRLIPWGDYSKVENFLNMGFGGGFLASSPLAPLGWTINCTLGTGDGQGELRITPVGEAWGIFGGTGGPQGQIQQGAYQDSFGNAILQPNTAYSVRLRAFTSGAIGNLIVDISSLSTGFVTQAVFSLSSITTDSTRPQFYMAGLGTTPAVIPSDLILRLYTQNQPPGQATTADELEVIYAVRPYRDNLARASYVINPEAFALTTGNLGAADDPSPIRCFDLLRNNVLLKTANGTHEFTANGGEPNTWVVNSLSRSVGALSIRSGDAGQFGTGDAAEDWDVSASDNGLYLFAGGDFWKVSQEYQTWWDRINRAARHTVWVKNDPGKRRIYVGVPLDTATTPNMIFVMDYRELDTATQIANAPPLHITLSGMMKSSDLTRKWTRWNLAMNQGEILARPGNVQQFCLAGNFGNAYILDRAKLTDDDYGAIGGAAGPYYVTYGFVNHDQEQQLQVGSHRKFFPAVAAFASGVGLIYFTPYVNSLNNPLPPSSFRQLVSDADQGTAQPSYLDWTTTIRGEFCFYKIQVAPLPGTTDVQLKVNKWVPSIMQDPVMLRRSSAI